MSARWTERRAPTDGWVIGTVRRMPSAEQFHKRLNEGDAAMGSRAGKVPSGRPIPPAVLADPGATGTQQWHDGHVAYQTQLLEQQLAMMDKVRGNIAVLIVFLVIIPIALGLLIAVTS